MTLPHVAIAEAVYCPCLRLIVAKIFKHASISSVLFSCRNLGLVWNTEICGISHEL